MYDKPGNTLVHSDSAGHIDVENFGGFSLLSDLVSDVSVDWPISSPRSPAVRPVGVRAFSLVQCTALIKRCCG